ncbi:MAG: signal peptidase I [Crocosphaera sp.]
MSEITTNRPPIMITQKEPRSLQPLPPLLTLPEPPPKRINPEIIRLQERESRLKQQLEIKKRLLGKYHPDVAKILNALVIVSIKQEKYKQAELFGDQVLELTQKLPPEKNPHLEESFDILVWLYVNSRKYKKLGTVIKQAVELRRNLLEKDPADIETLLVNLTKLYNNKEDNLESYCIPFSSMSPTLEIGDCVISNQLHDSSDKLERGDIVIFKPTETLKAQDFKKLFIKRIIGLPGERVLVKNGKVYINNIPLKESYIAEPPDYEYGPVTVPANSYFVLGDNRNNSYDSYYWGYVPQENIIEKISQIFWPLYRFGVIK